MTFYLQHFGLREAPFGATPMTEFFYGGGRRGEILHTLQYAINAGEGIVMVTGEVGSGKTMLLRSLLEKLQQQNIDLVYIPNPSLSGREILYNICEELELRMDENRPDTVRMLQNCLIERYAEGRRVVALIDEAQAMPDDSLEEVRLLSNLETARGKLLQIVLFGQPELEDKLRQQNMRQLRERITLALELKPFGLDDVRDYISTRLNAAGYDGGSLFSGGALKLITAVSQGLSRRINVLADKSLLSAFERQSISVTSADAKRAVQGAKYGKFQFYAEQKPDSKDKRPPWSRAALAFGAAAVVAAVVAIGVFGFGLGGGADWQKQGAQDASSIESQVTIAAQDGTAANGESDTVASLPQGEQQTPAEDADTAISGEVAADDNNTAITEDAAADASTVVGGQPPSMVSDAESSPNDGLLPPVPEDANTQAGAIDNVDNTTTATGVVAEGDNGGQSPAAEVAAQDDSAAGAAIDNNLTPVQEQQTPAPSSDNQSQNQSQNQRRAAGGYLPDAALPHFSLPGGAAGEVGDDARWRDMPLYLRARLNATQTFINTPGGRRGYTGRLMTVMQERAGLLDAFLRRFANFYPVGNVMVYPLRLGNTERFVVTFGIYDNREQAAVFVGNIPREFTDGKPFAQSLAESARESAAF